MSQQPLPPFQLPPPQTKRKKPLAIMIFCPLEEEKEKQGWFQCDSHLYAYMWLFKVGTVITKRSPLEFVSLLLSRML